MRLHRREPFELAQSQVLELEAEMSPLIGFTSPAARPTRTRIGAIAPGDAV
jgi:hypothetical protein